MSKEETVEQALIRVTDIKPKKEEARSKFLARLAVAANDNRIVNEEAWEELSEAAQDWVVETNKRVQTKRVITEPETGDSVVDASAEEAPQDEQVEVEVEPDVEVEVEVEDEPEVVVDAVIDEAKEEPVADQTPETKKTRKKRVRKAKKVDEGTPAAEDKPAKKPTQSPMKILTRLVVKPYPKVPSVERLQEAMAKSGFGEVKSTTIQTGRSSIIRTLRAAEELGRLK